MKVKLSDIIGAVDFANQHSEYFLDRETDEVVIVNDMLMTSDEKKKFFLACIMNPDRLGIRYLEGFYCLLPERH